MPEQKQNPVNKKLAIEYRSVAEIKPYSQNARTHSEAQIDAIVLSIKEFGWTNPILVDGKNGVIAGHCRMAAAVKLGMDLVPCIELGHLTPAQRRALVIADNQLGLRAGWDIDKLRFELGALQAGGFSLAPLGFEVAELASILDARPVGATDPDEVPEAPANPVTRLGDIWRLGRHRLLCGDATSAEDVGRLLGGAKPHLLVSDPPYGCDYDPNWRNHAAINGATAGRKRGVIGGRAIGKVNNDDRADWREAWILFTGDVGYVWHGALHASVVQQSLEAAGFAVRSQIIWAKNNIVISRGDYHFQHEPCWYIVRKGKAGHWQGSRTETSLWAIAKPQQSETGHSTQKPCECMRRPILNNSGPGDWIYDPFLGSGTTLIASEMTGRKALGIEIDPAYVSVAIERWQNFTGEKAMLGDKTFAQVKDERINGHRGRGSRKPSRSRVGESDHG
jgi:DNA modification methylase